MIYELRVYHMNTGKLPDINKRFANHTLELFAKHGIHVCDFWQDSEGAEKIYYICAFEDKATRDKCFETFGNDPEWIAVKEKSHENGVIVDRIDSSFMERVPYINPNWK